jgi:carboxylesterase
MRGHMGSRKDLAFIKYTEWIKSVELSLIELQAQYERVVIIGFSMGGLIAVNLATKYEVDGIITLNTPIYHWDIKRIIKNIISDINKRDYK